MFNLISGSEKIQRLSQRENWWQEKIVTEVCYWLHPSRWRWHHWCCRLRKCWWFWIFFYSFGGM